MTRTHRRFPASGWVGGVVLLALIAVIVTGPLWHPLSPTTANARATLQDPGPVHRLGTDELGRDVLARLLRGGRTSLSVGFLAAFTGVFVGTLVGAVAAYAKGWLGAVLMRLVDALLSIPSFFLILVVIAAVGNRPTVVILTIGFVSWPDIARIVYGEFQRISALEFVDAARSTGAGGARILIRHALPQAASQLVVLGTLAVGWAILSEAGLSYLGLGIQPPLPSWGNMLQAAQSYLWLKPALAIWPGLAITVTVGAITFLGNALRDRLDPRVG